MSGRNCTRRNPHSKLARWSSSDNRLFVVQTSAPLKCHLLHCLSLNACSSLWCCLVQVENHNLWPFCSLSFHQLQSTWSHLFTLADEVVMPPLSSCFRLSSLCRYIKLNCFSKSHIQHQSKVQPRTTISMRATASQRNTRVQLYYLNQTTSFDRKVSRKFVSLQHISVVILSHLDYAKLPLGTSVCMFACVRNVLVGVCLWRS